MSIKTMKAEKRTQTGKNNNYRLRQAGFIPGVVYSHGKAESIQLKEKEFLSVFKGHISESIIFDLNVSDVPEPYQVYVKDYQLHPVTDKIVHLDFFKVTAGEKIHTMIPVEVTGSAVGTKKGGVIELIERELEVKVLPRELPEKLILDVTSLDLHGVIKIKDIKAPASMVFLADPDHIVVHVVTHKEVSETEATGEVAASEE